MKVLVTGVAGFIGAALSHVLLNRGDEVVGIDNISDYYDVRLKKARLDRLYSYKEFSFVKLDISDRQSISDHFSREYYDVVVNLAAQAGVRHSIENPFIYIDSNLVGFGNILEGCRRQRVSHLVYASSSSVYGSNTKLPFSECNIVDSPISIYAATKKANELMAHSYSHLYQLPTTGLRFFTVYGPWGRPDMALFKFTKGILEGQPIPIYNYGKMVRDFTYIDDIIEGVIRTIDHPPDVGLSVQKNAELEFSSALHRIYNIGRGQPVPLLDYVRALENELGIKAQLNLLPLQSGDVIATEADVTRLALDFGYCPKVSIEAGIFHFVEWYCDYYEVQRMD